MTPPSDVDQPDVDVPDLVGFYFDFDHIVGVVETGDDFAFGDGHHPGDGDDDVVSDVSDCDLDIPLLSGSTPSI